MNRKFVLTTGISVLLLSLVFALKFDGVVKANPSVIRVPQDYLTIQAAINAANSGDTIQVAAGTYYENILLNKTVTLVGESMETTIIDGSEGERAVLVTANNATVKGFKIQNGLSGVELYSTIYSIISDNTITTRWPGYGVGLGYSHNNTVEHNNILGNKFQGIRLDESNGNIILGNNISNNGRGIDLVGYSRNTIIKGNNITGSSYYGISLGANMVYGNIIQGNTIANGEYYGIAISSSSNNKIYHNNFINNKKGNVLRYEYETGAMNAYDDGYPSGGNYWDDYKGLDEKSGPNQDQPGSDGIGDTPYIIDANNQDRYPLMEGTKVGAQPINIVPYAIIAIVTIVILAAIPIYFKKIRKR
jgi:parallel beta-helix repeat protein